MAGGGDHSDALSDPPAPGLPSQQRDRWRPFAEILRQRGSAGRRMGVVGWKTDEGPGDGSTCRGTSPTSCVPVPADRPGEERDGQLIDASHRLRMINEVDQLAEFELRRARRPTGSDGRVVLSGATAAG